MAKHYIDILNIAKESVDAQKLLHYRAPHTAKQVLPTEKQTKVYSRFGPQFLHCILVKYFNIRVIFEYHSVFN